MEPLSPAYSLIMLKRYQHKINDYIFHEGSITFPPNCGLSSYFSIITTVLKLMFSSPLYDPMENPNDSWC